MVIENYVDEEIPDWQTGDDDAHGIDVRAVVVFLADLPKKAFEASSGRLEARQSARQQSVMTHARAASPFLRLIDQETRKVAGEAYVASHGYEYLDNFVSDTLDLALAEVGNAVSYARRCGVTVTPERYSAGIKVTPARSFRRGEDIVRWEAGKRSAWRPTIRLTVDLSLDGPCRLVEFHAEDVRRAVSVCGPITSYVETGRTARNVSAFAGLPHLAARTPEIFG